MFVQVSQIRCFCGDYYRDPISGHKRLATLQRYVTPSQAVAALMAATDPDRRSR